MEREQPNKLDHVKASLERLEQAVGDIHDSEHFRKYLDAQARFWHYSWGNVMLIMFQRPDASRVAGFNTWKSLGRNVMRGEKGIRIIAPAFYKTREFDRDGREQEVQKTFFRSASVFDISQTEGKELPEMDVPVLEGEEGAELMGRMELVAKAEGVSVNRGHKRFEENESMMGFYDPAQKGIWLRQAAMRQMTKTLAHELAHHFAGHTASGPATETEAESVAYVVLSRYGVDSGERSFPYVALWAKDKSVFKDALGRIQGTSKTILDRLTALEAPQPSPRDLNGCGPH